jgi:NAD(P)-dependent dehydrogenase (short-subunit alcohol dehydrogenase family)
LADTKSILITGCSSGIGEACALGLKHRGYRVFATARKPEDLARLESHGLESFYLDYCEAESIDACVAEVSKRTGGKLYALFNNGAYGQPGALEDIPRRVLEAQFQANVFGWHQLARACLGLMRANGCGRLVQNSSVLGLVAMKWRGPYNASKFAIEALSDTMRLELRGSGIDVVLIEPGPIKSRFREHALAAFERNVDTERSIYRAQYERQRARLAAPEKPDEKSPGNSFRLGPEAVLQKLILALESRRPRARYYVTTPTRIMAWARRLLPPRLLDQLLNKASDS